MQTTAQAVPTTPTYQIPFDRHSFEMPGKSPACLVLHGFTGDPREMRTIVDAIHDQLGYYMSVPLLPGHGGPPHMLAGITTETFQQTVRDALTQVRAKHDRVAVIAYSMGAAIVAPILAEQPVDALVMLAPMLSIRNPLLPLSPLARFFMPWFYPLKLMNIDLLGIREEIMAFDPTLDLNDPHTLERLRNEIRFPIPITDELRKMQLRARPAAKALKMPTLIIQGSADLTLNPSGARRFFGDLGATDKEFKLIPRVDHDIVKTRNPGNREAVQSVVAWLKQRFG